MVNPRCPSVDTKKDKTWTYDEYYVGNRDQEERKNGEGSYHWTGSKSIEWYTGGHFRDTMHGVGEYRWRHIGEEGAHFTYEGHLYCNKMHGYGTTSYPDGRVFTGLFHSNMRWGPGVETHACLRQNVGLWKGKQLIRLAWQPATVNITPDLGSCDTTKAYVAKQRVLLIEAHKKIGQTNSALDLLKQYGANPMIAAKKWNKLYPSNCTDLASSLCYVDAFEHDYYKGKIPLLEEFSCTDVPNYNEDFAHDNENFQIYYAWNNNRIMIQMMQHSYTHDKQRYPEEINLADIISGPRNKFKTAGKHELDCRSLLISSFLGHTASVVELVNDGHINPDIADSFGNSAIMYATCGDEVEILDFLVEAGATVDNYNDACCTPLGVALLRFACAQKDISPSGMLQALLPPSPTIIPSPDDDVIFEWIISRDQVASGVAVVPNTTNKMAKPVPGTKKVKSFQSVKDESSIRKKGVVSPPKQPGLSENSSEESIPEDIAQYNSINNVFEEKINELFSLPSGVNSVPYLFEARNMIDDIHLDEEDPKKTHDKNPKTVMSKVLKDTMKPSKENMMWQTTDKDEFSSMNSVEKQKTEMLSRIMLIILQLLSKGADPNLVKCPQPALLIAIASGSSDLVKHLVNYGAKINENYSQILGYSPLDFAVSRHFTYENLELIRAILKCGAVASHRLNYDKTSSKDSIIPGPTLLHAVLARKTENEAEDQIRNNILELLLEFGANPIIQFKGRSAIDVAMNKNLDVFDIFIRNPTTNLNTPINDLNQSVLIKMFSLQFFVTIPSSKRLQMLTNLLLFGADPLIECMNATEKYPNIFVYAFRTLNECQAPVKSAAGPSTSATKGESKKGPPPKRDSISTKSIGKLTSEYVWDYKQAIDLVTECARLLHVRWLQAKLVKELVEVIYRYKHRQWNMIMKEHRHKKSTGLWVTTQRCLEIWDILKLTKRKVYKDDNVLKQLLYIVQYYNRLNKIVPSIQPTAEQKSSIEYNIGYLLKERSAAAKLTTNMGSWKKPYVKPELTSKAEEKKFDICFECALPFMDEKIKCVSCKMVAFCTSECMKINIERTNCHPCSSFLKAKYFPSPPESDDVIYSSGYYK